MMNKILVAVDSSPAANRAIKLAAEMARTYEAELLLLHVIRDMQLPSPAREVPEIEAFNTQREEIMRQVAEGILKEAENEADKLGVKTIKSAIGTGDPASSIISFAKRRSIDLIVLGTRGLGSSEGSIMGSVSRKVTNNSESNCLIVK